MHYCCRWQVCWQSEYLFQFKIFRVFCLVFCLSKHLRLSSFLNKMNFHKDMCIKMQIVFHSFCFLTFSGPCNLSIGGLQLWKFLFCYLVGNFPFWFSLFFYSGVFVSWIMNILNWSSLPFNFSLSFAFKIFFFFLRGIPDFIFQTFYSFFGLSWFFNRFQMILSYFPSILLMVPISKIILILPKLSLTIIIILFHSLLFPGLIAFLL